MRAKPVHMRPVLILRTVAKIHRVQGLATRLVLQRRFLYRITSQCEHSIENIGVAGTDEDRTVD
jgi:hypothetical protein